MAIMLRFRRSIRRRRVFPSSIEGRNIRAILVMVEGGFSEPLSLWVAILGTYPGSEKKTAKTKAFPGTANFFTKDSLPGPTPAVKRLEIFFTHPLFTRQFP
ncbi:hypothetical protein ACFL5A_01480 [Gemmatimonadota bacterium]